MRGDGRRLPRCPFSEAVTIATVPPGFEVVPGKDPNGWSFTWRLDVRTRRDGEFFLVGIADNGGGIPPESQPHIFALPFFTTKGGSGTGLGLVISHRIIVERHKGKIDFSTGPNGTQFNVRLPFESPAHA